MSGGGGDVMVGIVVWMIVAVALAWVFSWVHWSAEAWLLLMLGSWVAFLMWRLDK